MKKVKRCKKCVLPENFPHVKIDDKGVCNYCNAYKKTDNDNPAMKGAENRFLDILKKVKGEQPYDILLCYSGGKDSTYTLELLKKKYKLEILAYTFDNGFLAPRAKENIELCVEKLKVDHVCYKPSFDMLKNIFKVSAKKNIFSPKTIERAGTICTACTGMVKYSAMNLALEKNIPLIAFGWTPGQSPVEAAVLEIDPAMIKIMEGKIKKPLLKIAGDNVGKCFLQEEVFENIKSMPILVHPLAFNGYNETKILKSVKKLGWKMPKGTDLNATNCLLNQFSDKVHIDKYGFHPYVLEMANFVRKGYMTRSEALKHMPFKKDASVVRYTKKRLGL